MVAARQPRRRLFSHLAPGRDCSGHPWRHDSAYQVMNQTKLALVLLAVWAGGCAPRPSALRTNVPPVAADWATQTLRTLTLEQKVGQLLMGRVQGDFEN